MAGTTLGTFDYIAPEQAKDPRVADVRSDIYSLGCTLFHMLVGRPPYPEGTVLQKLLDHQNPVTPDVRADDPRIPGRLAALCRRMMASDPQQRPQTPEVLLEELDDLPRVRGLRQRRWRRNAGPLLTAAGAGTLAAALLAVVWVRWPAEPPPTYAAAPAAPVAPPAPAGSDVSALPAPPPAPAATPAAGMAATEAAGDEEPDTVVTAANTAAVAARVAPAAFVVTGADGAAPGGSRPSPPPSRTPPGARSSP